MMPTVNIDWLCSKITERSAKKIAQTVIELIENGEIPIGYLLPPMKSLAQALNISTATLSKAWAVLRESEAINSNSQGRLEIFKKPKTIKLRRFANPNAENQLIILDLSYSAPDISLIPELRKAMEQSVEVKDLHSPHYTPIIELLKHTVQPSWPYPAENFLVIDDTLQAISCLLQIIDRPNCYIAVEDPTTISLQDLVKKLGVKIIAVPYDEYGPTVDGLTAALKKKPVAFIYQPRNQTPTGYSMHKTEPVIKFV